MDPEVIGKATGGNVSKRTAREETILKLRYEMIMNATYPEESSETTKKIIVIPNALGDYSVGIKMVLDDLIVAMGKQDEVEVVSSPKKAYPIGMAIVPLVKMSVHNYIPGDCHVYKGGIDNLYRSDGSVGNCFPLGAVEAWRKATPEEIAAFNETLPINISIPFC